MTTRQRLMRMLLPLGLLACAVGATAEDGGLDPKIFNADFFPLLTWDAVRDAGADEAMPQSGLASIVECNFNIGGFAKPKDLPLAEKLGIKVIAMADVKHNGAWTKEWKTLSDEEIDRRVREMVAAAGDSPAVIGYFITDEPGASSFPALAKAVAAVKKYAPGKLAYINLFPGYATIGAPDQSQLEAASFTEYLERYVAEVKPQFISYDDYQVSYSMDMRNEKRAAVYYSDLLEVRRVAREHGLPFWNIVGSNQIRPNMAPPTPASLRLQAYTTLAAGGSGVSWYKYYGGSYGYPPIDNAGGRTPTWNYLRGVNQELRVLGPLMNRLEQTGLYFTAPPVPAAAALPGKLIEAIETDEPLMVGEFTHEDGTPYVMLVNMSLERTAKLVPRRDGKPLEGQIVSSEDGHPIAIDYKYGFYLTPGQGVLVRLAAQ